MSSCPTATYAAVGPVLAGPASTRASVDFTVDTSIPLPPTVNPVATSDTTPTITGTGEVGAVISLYVDGGLVECGNAPVIVDEGADWSCTLAAPLGVGTHDVSARQVDRAGNVSPIGPTTPTLVITPSLIPSCHRPLAMPTPTPTPTPTTPPLVLLILVWTLGGASGEYSPAMP